MYGVWARMGRKLSFGMFLLWLGARGEVRHMCPKCQWCELCTCITSLAPRSPPLKKCLHTDRCNTLCSHQNSQLSVTLTLNFGAAPRYISGARRSQASISREKRRCRPGKTARKALYFAIREEVVFSGQRKLLRRSRQLQIVVQAARFQTLVARAQSDVALMPIG